MLELNEKTQQDFLNREWVQKLMDARVDMSDAKYCIVTWGLGEGTDFIKLKSSVDYLLKTESTEPSSLRNIIPTYTVSELLNKLPIYRSIVLKNEEIIKTHLFQGHDLFGNYISGYFFSEVPINCMRILRSVNSSFALEPYDSVFKEFPECRAYDIEASSKYPIEALASLLIQCHKKGVGNTGNISNK